MQIKQCRKNRGLTQAQTAAALGIPTRTYQNYELESRNPDLDVLCAMADLFGVTLDELMGRAPMPQEQWTETLDRSEKMLIDRYRSMSEQGRGLLLSIAESVMGAMPKDEE